MTVDLPSYREIHRGAPAEMGLNLVFQLELHTHECYGKRWYSTHDGCSESRQTASCIVLADAVSLHADRMTLTREMMLDIAIYGVKYTSVCYKSTI